MLEFWQTKNKRRWHIFRIIGFIFMLKSTKTLRHREGEFNASECVDPDTGKPPATAVGPPEPNRYLTGISLIVAGLIVQIFAMFVKA